MKTKFELPSYEILRADDDRNEAPSFPTGVFFVHKVRMIAQFSFGGTGSFSSGEKAKDALSAYLSKRKDAKDLTVTLIER